MRQWRQAALCVAVVAGISVVSSFAGAQKPRQPGTQPSGFDALLIRQDNADCTNTNVSGSDPTRVVGTALVSKGTAGNFNVDVAVTGTPSTTYQFNLKCIRFLGNVVTGDEGVGLGSFSFPSSAAGATFAFDVFPAGKPSGNILQSLTVNQNDVK